MIPVGETGHEQTLRVYTRTESGTDVRDVVPVRFVPMTGTVREQP